MFMKSDKNYKNEPASENHHVVPQDNRGQVVTQVMNEKLGSVIGRDLKITGQQINIVSEGRLTVDGEIEADLKCDELIIGQQAQIKGNVAADSVAVHGQVSGSIEGARVELCSTAKVDGDIRYEKMAMEEGAAFDGRLSKLPESNTFAPEKPAIEVHGSHQSNEGLSPQTRTSLALDG